MTVWLGTPLTVSNSELQTWKSCHRKWFLTYYRELGLRRGDVSPIGARKLGSRIHVALHALYASEENPLTVLNALYDGDAQLLLDALRPEDEIELRKEQDLAKAMIEGFLQWRADTGLDDGMELVAAETVIDTPSAIEGVRLRGKLDQRHVRKVDGARLFRDWKTVGNLSEPQTLLPLDEQLKFYHLLEYLDAMEKTGSEPQWRTDGGLYTMLRKVKRTAAAKPPFYGQVEVRHNMHELRSMWKRVHKELEEIVLTRQALDAGGDHQVHAYPRPSRDCSWSCDFLPVCPMMDDGSNWEGLLSEYYVHTDPHQRYAAQDEGKEVTE